VFGNANNVTFGMSNLTITASASGGGGGVALIASNTTFTSGTISVLGSDMVTVKSAGSEIIIDATQSVQTQNLMCASILTAGNTTGTMTIISSGTMQLAGGNNITLSQNGQCITIVGPSTAAVALSAPSASASAGTIIFSNSNDISFGMTGSTVTASVGSTTVQSYNGGIAAGTQTLTSGTCIFLNSNGVSFGMSGTATVTASVASLMPTLQAWCQIEEVFGALNSVPQGSVSVQPVFLPFYVTATEIDFAVSMSVATNTSNTSASCNISINVGLYSLSYSTQAGGTTNELSLATSSSGVVKFTWSSNTTGSVTGMKRLTCPFSANITPGLWWLGVAMSTATTYTGQSMTIYGNSAVPNASNAMNLGYLGSGTATYGSVFPWQGIYTVQQSNVPNAISTADLNITSASNVQIANVWFALKNSVSW
jgi:hypothetical protein